MVGAVGASCRSPLPDGSTRVSDATFLGHGNLPSLIHCMISGSKRPPLSFVVLNWVQRLEGEDRNKRRKPPSLSPLLSVLPSSREKEVVGRGLTFKERGKELEEGREEQKVSSKRRVGGMRAVKPLCGAGGLEGRRWASAPWQMKRKQRPLYHPLPRKACSLSITHSPTPSRPLSFSFYHSNSPIPFPHLICSLYPQLQRELPRAHLLDIC